jgi:hypothetical protein
VDEHRKSASVSPVARAALERETLESLELELRDLVSVLAPEVRSSKAPGTR